MDGLPITELLSSRGFEGEGAERALETLYREGLTRPGKTRIAAANRPNAASRDAIAPFCRPQSLPHRALGPCQQSGDPAGDSRRTAISKKIAEIFAARRSPG